MHLSPCRRPPRRVSSVRTVTPGGSVEQPACQLPPEPPPLPDRAHDLHVLLRHRAPSIPPLGGSSETTKEPGAQFARFLDEQTGVLAKRCAVAQVAARGR